MNTTVYRNATCWTYYFGQDAAEHMPCEVRISDENGEIVVSYEGEEGYTLYSGKENGVGHYELRSENPRGRASLHQFPDGRILEGFWEENGCKGMWRIELGETGDTVTGLDALNSSEEIDEPDDELGRLVRLGENDHDSGWEAPIRRYSFPLREETRIVFRIPEDITRKEARRLAGFILSLSWA